VVPLKYFADAKSRLANVLSPVERQLLVRYMARDLLGALATLTAEANSLTGILITSREHEVATLAEEFGAEVFSEPDHADLSRSVTLASDWLMHNRAASGTLIVHADLPLASPADFAKLLAAHSEFTLVPDDEHLGTNCLLATPPNPIEYHYNGRSFKPHLAAARQAGIEPKVCEIPGLGLDIDTEQDLKRLLGAFSADRNPRNVSETATYLESSGIAQRLSTPHNAG
jgi:2-phospho-L-lactate guanylyltransferase